MAILYGAGGLLHALDLVEKGPFFALVTSVKLESFASMPLSLQTVTVLWTLLGSAAGQIE